MKTRIIRANGSEVEVKPLNGKNFRLKEMQTIVGGYIQALYFHDFVMITNEDGKVIGLTYNEPATELLAGSSYAGQFITGDVLVCQFSEFK